MGIIGADAIVVSSLYGQGELDCRGMREKCDETGLKGILLIVVSRPDTCLFVRGLFQSLFFTYIPPCQFCATVIKYI